MDKRIITSDLLVDEEMDGTLRPQYFKEYIGQKEVK